MSDTYSITRVYFNSDKYPSRLIKSGLTLEEAQAHCRDPETSSRSATQYEGRKRTIRRGPWFDSYSKE